PYTTLFRSRSVNRPWPSVRVLAGVPLPAMVAPEMPAPVVSATMPDSAGPDVSGRCARAHKHMVVSSKATLARYMAVVLGLGLGNSSPVADWYRIYCNH